ncbi:hypothetical protein NEUTE1DRAFT_107642 [Neurospora tetrasperma FGSC 2508]|uniref:Uncharacterized protein n=1 Tax=Neurospora tetrasperma (strain FGSC 2508 / ATCC MYA-4615 / P0657) TaxID=510951 RepID=F8MBC4_NEUT8|nr:uncharacterized protein NEUTE1DRAFT_107642 [Neurospora tetrasperma FGSC 2508]EGO61089.1 hypothetical protein NEUTE1DRAFT_107642 [Neurospora tetrasperma FGSC 2508]
MLTKIVADPGRLGDAAHLIDTEIIYQIQIQGHGSNYTSKKTSVPDQSDCLLKGICMESGNIPAYLPTPMPPVCSICQPRAHRHGPGLLLPRHVIEELQGDGNRAVAMTDWPSVIGDTTGRVEYQLSYLKVLDDIVYTSEGTVCLSTEVRIYYQVQSFEPR